MRGHGLPIADVVRFDRFGVAAGGEDDAEGAVVAVGLHACVCGLHARGPNAVLVVREADYSPSRSRADAADFIQDRLRGWPRRDEDVVREILNLVLGAVVGQFDEGFEAFDVLGGDEVAGVEDGALDFVGAGAFGGYAVEDGLVVFVDHLLDFGDFGDGVHGALLVCYLDHFGVDWLARGRAVVVGVWVHEA